MTRHELARRLLREPLVHFLVCGAVVYGLMAGRPAEPEERRIIVNEAVVGRLVNRWTATYRREPTPAEIDGIIRDYVADQIYYREGLRLGLDRDDEVVVRRMRVKMLELAGADADMATPRDAELQRFLDAHRERYVDEPRLDFEQLYLGADNAAGRATAREVLARLKAGEQPRMRGTPAPIDRHFAGLTPGEIDERFGSSFADGISELATGQWHGPFVSGFGLHLVRIERRQAAKPPRLSDIRQRVENDWRAAAIEQAEQANYRRIAAGYDVVIEDR